MVIVVINESDLRNLAEGANLITMLRRKYEETRLDLRLTGVLSPTPVTSEVAGALARPAPRRRRNTVETNWRERDSG